MTTPLYGHTSPETAYVVKDYPYGFRLRCQIRYWLEYKPRHGWRFVSQTTNPKASGESWNKPKASGYVLLAAAMYLDDDGHVQWSGLTEYSNAAEAAAFIAAYPEADTSELKAWIMGKAKYYTRVLAHIERTGMSPFTINGVAEPATEDEIERAKRDLADWQALTLPTG